MKILALAAYPERIASTRFRICRYVEPLRALGIDVELVPWLDDGGAAALYRKGGLPRASVAGSRGVLRQLRAVTRGGHDAVWVQREAVLAGPPIVEALALARAPLVLDYDDAVWIAQGHAIKRAAKLPWKFDWVLRRATHAIAGSTQLAAHARALGVATTVVPTVVERAAWTPRTDAERPGPLVVGWIGTHSTAPQLALVAPALRRLRAEGRAFRFVVVGAGEGFRLDGVDVEIRPWTLATEIDAFRDLDVGLAPMQRSAWHEGKCGFKQIQYMAVGVPCVSSLVGGARDFVVDEVNALVAETEDDWYRQLLRLLTDGGLRARLAARGRALVESRLCVEEQAHVVANVLREAAVSGPRR